VKIAILASEAGWHVLRLQHALEQRFLAKGNLDVPGKLNKLKRMPGKPQTREIGTSATEPVVREPREVERFFEARNDPGNRNSR
jgi:hypothetical protein